MKVTGVDQECNVIDLWALEVPVGEWCYKEVKQEVWLGMLFSVTAVSWTDEQ